METETPIDDDELEETIEREEPDADEPDDFVHPDQSDIAQARWERGRNL